MKKDPKKQDHIYAEALRLFAEKGFPDTTIDDIVDAVGVGKGTFYSYFPNKEAVLLGLIKESFTQAQKAIAQSYRLSGGAAENISRAFRAHIKFFQRQKDFIKLLEGVKIQYFSVITTLFMDCFAQDLVRYREMIALEIKAGHMRRIDIDVFFLSLMGISHMFIFREIKMGIPIREKDLKHIQDVILHGLLIESGSSKNHQESK